MTETQLIALIGCTLKYKLLSEYIITNVTDDSVTYIENNSNSHTVNSDYFICEFLPRLKIYLTEEEDSLTSIDYYLKHYDLK